MTAPQLFVGVKIIVCWQYISQCDQGDLVLTIMKVNGRIGNHNV